MKKMSVVRGAGDGPAMPRPDWLPTLRALVRTYQAFDLVSERNIRNLKLTGPQFDIIATLGNTDGMTCKELGNRTLITKGTLTGVLDRLEGKGLLKRKVSPDDRRVYVVRLTEEGQRCFEAVFPRHIAYMDPMFRCLSADDYRQLERLLDKLRRGFEGKPLDDGAKREAA